MVQGRGLRDGGKTEPWSQQPGQALETWRTHETRNVSPPPSSSQRLLVSIAMKEQSSVALSYLVSSEAEKPRETRTPGKLLTRRDKLLLGENKVGVNRKGGTLYKGKTRTRPHLVIPWQQF